MAYRVLAPDGTLRVIANPAFLRRIQRLSERNSNSGNSADAFEKVAHHPYIHIDPRGNAERDSENRYHNRLKGQLTELSSKLNEGTLQQNGLEGTSGQAKLTTEKLTAHGVRLIGGPEDSVLLRIDRHPERTSTKLRVQYWLYQPGRRGVTLLKHRENIDVPERGERLVFRGGEWCPPDETIERSFYDLVSAVLGSSVATQIRSEIHANDSGILHVIPEQVAAECRELGMDVAKFNSDLREATRRELNGKFGPGKPISGSPPGIALVDAPIRLGFAE